MKLKPLLLLVALLGLASVLVLWRSSAPTSDASADPRTGQPLGSPAILASFRGLRLTADGQSVVLTADRDGRNWTVPDYFALPADFSKLVAFVESLRTAKTTRFVTAAPDRLARLGFGGDAIELRDADGKPVWTLQLGKNNETGGRFVRFGTEPKAYLAELNVWLDAVAKNWARAQLLDLKPADVAAVELRFADGTALTAKRNADATAWTADALPEGKELKSATIDSLVSQLGTLRFSETAELTAPDAIAAHEHTQTAVLTLKDGTAYTVVLGRRPAPPVPAKAATPAARSGPISATTPPVTIGPDGKVQVVDLPAETRGNTGDAGATTAQPETLNSKPAASSAASAKEETAPAPPPPPGPVFAFISANREADPINAVMQKRAFQVGEWLLNSLPTNRAALLQDKTTPPPPSTTAPAPVAPTAPTPTAPPPTK